MSILVDQFRGAGVFGKYTLCGSKYRKEDYRTGWQVECRVDGEETHIYWIEGHEFHAASVHYAHPITNATHIDVGGIITDIDPGERAAIENAIKAWRLEENAKLLDMSAHAT